MSVTPTLIIKNGNAPSLLQQLGHVWEQQVEKDCQRYSVCVPRGVAIQGEVIAYQPEPGIDVLIFDCAFNEELTIRLEGNFPAPLHFFTQAKGKLSVRSSDLNFEVNPLQCSIHGGFTGQDVDLHFPAQTSVMCMITFVHKDRFFADIDCAQLAVPDELLTTIEDMEQRQDSFLFQNIFHLPAINALNEILQQDHVGLLNTAYATAKIYENLFLQLETYKRSIQRQGSRNVKMDNKLKLILDAEGIICANLNNPPTIPRLARMVGTNQQDLKMGFREVYGATINQYLTDRRLEQAGVLLRGGEMSVADVAAAVGYNSPGYFTRRFKEKYGTSPRQFMRTPDVHRRGSGQQQPQAFR